MKRCRRASAGARSLSEFARSSCSVRSTRSGHNWLSCNRKWRASNSSGKELMRHLILLAVVHFRGPRSPGPPESDGGGGQREPAIAETGRGRSGRRFGLRCAGTDPHRSRGNRRHHPSAAAEERHRRRRAVSGPAETAIVDALKPSRFWWTRWSRSPWSNITAGRSR